MCQLFSRFCRNQLRALPWSNHPPSKETLAITEQLAKMNELGYLTINSQPAVDGAPSNDPTHGWGPKNGYVYQKAYLEFFVGPTLLNDLIRRIERDPRITYYAVNKQGDLRTNTHSEGPNAVTWGVYPGKEIIQPTIVEAVSFIAWKDEAFELGMQWANMYERDSQSHKLIADIMETSYLVNIVANDFKDGESIFEPFQLNVAVAASLPAPAKGDVGTPSTNGHSGDHPAVPPSNGAGVQSNKPTVNGVSNRQTNGDAILTDRNVVAENSDTSDHRPPPPAAAEAASAVGPAPRKQQTMADIDELLRTSPLFMRELPEDGGASNDTLEALKTLVFDGTGDGETSGARGIPGADSMTGHGRGRYELQESRRGMSSSRPDSRGFGILHPRH